MLYLLLCTIKTSCFSLQFPSLLSNIKGEEQNSFMNSLGQSIHVELTASEEDTASLLSKVLDGKDHLATSLASVVHSRATTCKRQLSSRAQIPADSIGIWIDPIGRLQNF